MKKSDIPNEAHINAVRSVFPEANELRHNTDVNSPVMILEKQLGKMISCSKTGSRKKAWEMAAKKIAMR
jgi:hypothetical protein